MEIPSPKSFGLQVAAGSTPRLGTVGGAKLSRDDMVLRNIKQAPQQSQHQAVTQIAPMDHCHAICQTFSACEIASGQYTGSNARRARILAPASRFSVIHTILSQPKIRPMRRFATFTGGAKPVYFSREEIPHMSLEFRGAASMDPPQRGVRFAGYPVSSRHSAMVICEVSTDALRLLGEMPDANGEELMGLFEIYKETILAIASRKFDKGDMRPRITGKDIENRPV
jgi:hypothetical protein